ncbi:hypothetical protein [Hymenobacter negativus]|uniref:Uncharacterized protein n=1 Tax=Hymenobacter negativus TaxID=2795026 RepID=A0ABS3QIE1_9BACT|nr:hypothetical protein [Hymenobacter negativus]MBO2010778.1 hypothetical protein [Hymenobacter negativus]
MSDSPTDFYHQKTDAELQFFVDNPGYYQPELVQEARLELRRRGVGPVPPAPVAASVPEPAPAPAAAPVFAAPAPAPSYQPASKAAPASGLPGFPVVMGVAVVLALSVGGFYYVKQKNSPVTSVAPVADVAPVTDSVPAADIAPATEADPAAEATPARKNPPELTEVATSVVPTFDVPAIIEQQLKHVPATERAAAAQAGQPLRQYRELAKRFWTAETQTEYLLQQAQQGKLDTALPGHVEAAEVAWQQLNKATVYSYKFGPAMTSHLDIMSRVGRQQQEALSDLLLVANNPQSYENSKTRQRAADVNDLLSGLLPKSPVTGEPYVAIVRRVTL